MALRSASQPNLMGSPPRRRSAVSRRLAPLSPQRGRRRAGGASSVEPRYIPGRSRLLETDHSLEDVSFRFPDEVDGELTGQDEGALGRMPCRGEWLHHHSVHGEWLEHRYINQAPWYIKQRVKTVTELARHSSENTLPLSPRPTKTGRGIIRVDDT
jgi:hypothetical protein